MQYIIVFKFYIVFITIIYIYIYNDSNLVLCNTILTCTGLGFDKQQSSV